MDGLFAILICHFLLAVEEVYHKMAKDAGKSLKKEVK